jgi:hypothetical protein
MLSGCRHGACRLSGQALTGLFEQNGGFKNLEFELQKAFSGNFEFLLAFTIGAFYFCVPF